MEWYWKTPYVFGGRHESQGGLDCAGFVMAVFERAGIDIDPAHTDDYTNAERLRGACDDVAAGDERVGDLVFFRNTYATVGASHIGIVMDPVAQTMMDDHDRKPYGPGLTNYGSAYWQQHLLSFGRVRRP